MSRWDVPGNTITLLSVGSQQFEKLWYTLQLRYTHPRSRNDLSCWSVRRRGSPWLSVATASSSSNGGAINRSRKFIGRAFLLLLFVADTKEAFDVVVVVVVAAVVVVAGWPPAHNGFGRTVQVKTKSNEAVVLRTFHTPFTHQWERFSSGTGIDRPHA